MGIPANISRNERVLLKGLIEELGEGASTLADLTDVDAQNRQGGDSLVWDEELGMHVYQAPPATGASPGVLDSVTTSFASAAANPQTVNPGTIIWLPEPTYQTSNPPIGYMHANGGNRVRSEYPDLFNAIGTTFNNEGSSGTTFGIPNELELDNPYNSETYRAYIRTGVVSALTGVILSGSVNGNQFRTYSLSAANVASPLTPYNPGFAVEQQSISANGAYGVAYTDNGDNFAVLRRVGGNWFPCTLTPAWSGLVTHVRISNTGNYLLISSNNPPCTYIYRRTGDTEFGDRQLIDSTPWESSSWFNANDTAVFGVGQGRPYRLSVLEAGVWSEAVTRMTAYTSWPWVAFHPTNSLVAATHPSGGIQVFSRVGNVLDAVPGAPAGQGGATTWVDFSTDGQYLVCGAFQSWGPRYLRAWRVQDQNFTPITVDASTDIRGAWNPYYMAKIPGRSSNTWLQSTDMTLLTISNDTLFSTPANAVTGVTDGTWSFLTNQLATAGFIPA